MIGVDGVGAAVEVGGGGGGGGDGCVCGCDGCGRLAWSVVWDLILILFWQGNMDKMDETEYKKQTKACLFLCVVSK